ncbi:hypothetical protein [Actinoplanes sp. NPDC049118]|uniref:hypothetical protein n=1 Tax=Actinoplanes sp. NPDC049118 TaxID=3155769 RepID=UPI0033DDA008
MDVGDAVELIFTTTPGATVTATWSRPDGTVVIDAAPVVESPSAPGQYPATFIGDQPGLWRAVFRSTGTAAQSEAYHVRFRTIDGPPPLATVEEYTELFGALSPAREALVRALLRRASQLVRDTYPTLGERIASGQLPGDSVGLAVLNMTVRVMRNPDGLRAQTTGPFSRSYDPDLASGLLALTAADTTLLAGVRRNRRRAGTIWTRPGHTVDLRYLDHLRLLAHLRDVRRRR